MPTCHPDRSKQRDPPSVILTKASNARGAEGSRTAFAQAKPVPVPSLHIHSLLLDKGMENPSDKPEVDMWNVAAGCLAAAGILSREPGLTLAGLFIWVGRRYSTRDTRAPEPPIDSLLQARRSLIGLAVTLFVLAALVHVHVKNEDCAADDVGAMILLLHFVLCWSLWRNFALEKRTAIAWASLAILAVVLVEEHLPSGCERHAQSLIFDVLGWLLYLDDAAICVIALMRSPEEKHSESPGPLTVPRTIDRESEPKRDVTSIFGFHSRSVALWLVLTLTFLLLFKTFSGPLGKPQPNDPEIRYSDFLNWVDRGKVATVTIQGHSIHGQLVSGDRFLTYAPDDPDLIKKLREKDVKILAKP
jgi:hypothetical protein